MNDPQQLLAQLREIHAPPPLSWWPPAPGWWLSALVLILVVAAIVWLVKQRRAMAMHVAALRRLDEIDRNFRRSGDGAQLAQAVSILLRRFAVNTFPSRDIGGLHGERWLEFLDSTGGNGDFGKRLRESLLEAPYRRDAQVDGDALLTTARRWLRNLPRTKLSNGVRS